MARSRPDGWWYPWTFVAAMLIVIAVNAVMISYAIDTFPGLDTENAYQKGIDYNHTLAAAREQEARGWRAEIEFKTAREPGSERTGDLIVSLTDRDGAPLPDLSVTTVFLRPTHTAEDFTVALDRRDTTHYGASVTLPHAGQWDAWVRASGPAGEFQTTQRIFVP